MKSENIVINVFNHKENSIEKIVGFVKFLCYKTEHEKLSKSFSTMRSLVEQYYPAIDDVTALEAPLLFLVDGLDVQKFIETKAELQEVRKILAKLDSQGINKSTYNTLTNTDKISLILQAHTAVKSIKLDESVLVKEDGTKYDFSPLFKKWYESGQGLSNIKKACSKIFSNLMKEDGILFYAIKIRGGDIPDKDIRHFLAMSGGKAVREGKAKTGKFKWDEKYDEKAVLSHLTTLLAVVFESGNCETIKPEKKPAEKPEKKPEK